MSPALDCSPEEMRELEPALLRYARRAVRDGEAAKDLVQDTFVAAMSSTAPFEGRSKLRTWLIGILSHKALDFLRREAVKNKAASEETTPDDLTSPPAASPERILARKQALCILDEALQRLPDLERLAILLVDVEGADHQEACNGLSINATHLRVLLHRARHRLRKELENVHLRSSP